MGASHPHLPAQPLFPGNLPGEGYTPSTEVRFRQAEAELIARADEHELRMTSPTNMYEAQVRSMSLAPNERAFMGAADRQADVIERVTKKAYRDVGDLFARRARIATEEVCSDQDGVRQLSRVAAQYGVLSDEVFDVYRIIGLSDRRSARAVLDAAAYEQAIDTAYQKGVAHPDVADIVQSMSVPMRRAAHAGLDKLRLKQARKLSRKQGLGPGFEGVQDILRSASVTSRPALRGALDGLCYTKAITANRKNDGARSSAIAILSTGASSQGVLGTMFALMRKQPGEVRAGSGVTSLYFEARPSRRRVGRAAAIATAASLLVGGGLAGAGIVHIGGDEPAVTAESFGSDRPEATATPSPTAAEERSDIGLCISAEATALLETDCNLLPRVQENANFTPAVIKKFDDGMEYVEGEVVIGGYRNGVEDFDKLSPEYQEALRVSLRDPFVRLVYKNLPIAIEHDPRASEENGWFSPIGDDGKPLVRFVFTTDERVSDDKLVFLTWGTLRDTLIHEGAHSLHNSWKEKAKHDPFYASRMKEMTSLCRAEMRYVVGEYYDNGGREEMLNSVGDFRDIVGELRDDKRMNHKQAAKAGRGLNRVSNILRTKAGYQDAVVTDDCDVNNVTGLTYEKTNMALDEFMDVETKKGVKQFNELYNAKWPQIDHMSKATGYMREGVQLKGIDGERAGHPFDPDEQQASVTACIQMDPEGYTSDVLALPPKRRDQRIRFTEVIYELMREDDPALAASTNFVPVLKALKQGSR